jgi:hypothetical protein
MNITTTTLVEVYKLNLSLAIQVQVLLDTFFFILLLKTHQSIATKAHSDRSNEVTQKRTMSPRRL